MFPMLKKLIKFILFLGISSSLFAGEIIEGVSSNVEGKNGNKAFEISDYKGQFVYLDFWASWCGPCRASFPWMNALQKDFQDKGLKIISVNLDAEREDANKFLIEFPAEFDVIFDPKGRSAEQYELLGMPSSFFFDRQGKLLFSHVGFNHKNAPRLRAKIQSALNL